ncbi:hypothetical protein CN142_37870, partial [Sinorhizobium meliloti]
MRKANYGISCNAVPYRDRRAGLNGREGVASCRAYIEQSIGGCYSVKCYSFVRNHVVSSAHDVFERIVESLDPLAGGRTPYAASTPHRLFSCGDLRLIDGPSNELTEEYLT